MLNKVTWVVVILMGVLFTGSQHIYADVVATLDMQKIFLNYTAAQAADKEFKEKQKTFQKDIAGFDEKIERAKKDNKSEEDIAKLEEEKQKELEPKQKELLDFNTRVTSRLQQEILAAVNKVAKEYDIDVVLRSQLVLYGGFDLTDFVLEKLNKKK